MGLVEFFKKFGNKNLMFQRLDHTMTNIKSSRGISSITFKTDQITPNEVFSNQGKIAFIVWMDREQFEEISKSFKK